MIGNLTRYCTILLGRFHRDDEGVAAVEFALIVPFLMLLYFGSMEASALFTADRRVNTISATLGDLVSQWDDDDGNIPLATLSDYAAAAQSLIYPMSTNTMRQVVTGVQVNDNGTTKVLWSKGYNGGAARHVDDAYPLPATDMMNQVARRTGNKGFLIASETYYSYKPMLAQVFQTALSLYHENLYLPRFGAKVQPAS